MSATSGAAYGTGTASIMIGISSWGLNEWAVAIGILCTVGTFAINWYYKRQDFKLKQKRANISDEELEG